MTTFEREKQRSYDLGLTDGMAEMYAAIRQRGGDAEQAACAVFQHSREWAVRVLRMFGMTLFAARGLDELVLAVDVCQMLCLGQPDEVDLWFGYKTVKL